jgi:hypothetical protein
VRFAKPLLFVGKADFDQALAALEAVFPRHHQTQGRAVLLGQGFAIHAKRQQGQWVHGFIHA